MCFGGDHLFFFKLEVSLSFPFLFLFFVLFWNKAIWGDKAWGHWGITSSSNFFFIELITFLVVVIKYLTRNYWRECGFIWHTVWGNADHHGGAGGGWLHCFHSREAKWTGNGIGLWNLKVHPHWLTFSLKALPPKGSTIFQNSTTSVGTVCSNTLAYSGRFRVNHNIHETLVPWLNKSALWVSRVELSLYRLILCLVHLLLLEDCISSVVPSSAVGASELLLYYGWARTLFPQTLAPAHGLLE